MLYFVVAQEISFFDDKDNNTGALTTRLATDASLVQGVRSHGTYICIISMKGHTLVITNSISGLVQARKLCPVCRNTEA